MKCTSLRYGTIKVKKTAKESEPNGYKRFSSTSSLGFEFDYL